MSPSLLIERDGRVLHLTINRPEKRNALNLELCRALADALDAADADPGIGAILLSANGKAFCSGMDLSEVLTADQEAVSDFHERLFSIGHRLSTPVVAAVQGAAIAGGTGLVAACHVAVAADDAVFGLTEIRIGLWPFVILRAMVRAMGERRAMELCLTGRTFGAAEALQYNMIDHVSIPANVGAVARQIANALASSSPMAVRTGLGCFREIRGRSWEEAGEISRSLRNQLFDTPEFREAVQAFLKK